MPKIPVLTDKQVVKILLEKGFIFLRQKGSHSIYKEKGLPLIIVPMHGKELRRGLLAKIIKDAGLEELFYK